MQFKFTKWHGLGNDFVIVNGFTEKITDYSDAAIKVCDRHLGIGADGLVLILPSETADFEMRIFNSDGSEAEMCGNVTRCVARHVYECGLTSKTKITIETKAGIIVPELIIENGKIKTIKVDMGEPRLKRQDIPTAGLPNESLVNLPLHISNNIYNITCVSMGNPHCVIFVDNINDIDLSSIGPQIEKHELFPRKTNVEFAQVKNEQHIRMRVWERGAGITMACGTGACATLVAAVLNNKADRKATIELDGGELIVEWNKADNHVYMSGPATEVFRGEYVQQ
ncbi:diaminopimelate epimerase [Sporomusaceae bacterium FL31]|nr:diaminopimelate epimerase [Sporomusaceae bacterium FL31]GCE35952.1 diaminopimelate epimerase [Sporomusaceae bacterium]